MGGVGTTVTTSVHVIILPKIIASQTHRYVAFGKCGVLHLGNVIHRASVKTCRLSTTNQHVKISIACVLLYNSTLTYIGLPVIVYFPVLKVLEELLNNSQEVLNSS